MRASLRALTVMALLAAVPCTARGVMLEFSGKISQVYDPCIHLAHTINPGDVFTALVTYDPNAMDSDINPNQGIYNFAPSGGYGIKIMVDGWTFQTNPGAFTPFVAAVTNNLGGDSIGFLSDHNMLPPGTPAFTDGRLAARLDDPTGTVFPNDHLPSSLNINQFSSARIEVLGISAPLNQFFQFSGDVLNVQVVPEPGTIVSLAMGALGLGVFGLRRRIRK